MFVRACVCVCGVRTNILISCLTLFLRENMYCNDLLPYICVQTSIVDRRVRLHLMTGKKKIENEARRGYGISEIQGLKSILKLPFPIFFDLYKIIEIKYMYIDFLNIKV